MKKINLAITGCMGRMGQQLIKSSKKNRNFKLVSLTENRLINKKIVGLRPSKNNVNAFKKTKSKFFVISVTSDWLYLTQENKDIVIALNAIGVDVGFVEIKSDKGHDSFLLDVPDFLKTLKNFLDKSYSER